MIFRPAVSSRLYPRRSHHAYHALLKLGDSLRTAINDIDELGSVMDFGCGDQPYRSLFHDRAREYIGADLPDVRGTDVLLTADGTLPVADGSVDTVFSTQVLEHVADPGAYLGEAFRVLRPGGHLLLSTHGVWRYHPHPEDYWRWTLPGLRRVVVQAGFDVLNVEGVLGPAATGMQLWQDALLAWLPAPLHKPLILTIQPMVALSDRIGSAAARASDAAIFVLLARRPEATQ